MTSPDEAPCPPATLAGDSLPAPAFDVGDLLVELQLRNRMLLLQQHKIVQLQDQLRSVWERLGRLLDETERAQTGSAPAATPAKATPEQGKEEGRSRYWTADEHKRFLEAIEIYGPRRITEIANYVRTRSATQVRTHAQKFYLRLRKGKSDGALDSGLDGAGGGAGGSAMEPSEPHSTQLAGCMDGGVGEEEGGPGAVDDCSGSGGSGDEYDSPSRPEKRSRVSGSPSALV